MRLQTTGFVWGEFSPNLDIFSDLHIEQTLWFPELVVFRQKIISEDFIVISNFRSICSGAPVYAFHLAIAIQIFSM